MDSTTKLFQEFWDWRMERTPEFSSLAGETRHNDKLEDFTLERFEADNESCKSFLKRAEAMLRGGSLTEADTLNLRLFKAELETFISGYTCQGFLFPINYMEGVHVDFQRLAEWVTFRTAKDYGDMIRRYEKFDKQAQGIVEVLKAGVKLGKVNHAISMAGVIEGFQEHLKDDPAKTIFYKIFADIPDSILEKGDLQEKALAAISSSVQPGMRRIKTYLEEEYLRHTRPDIAISSIPGGKEFYEQCIRFHTSTDLTAREIHEIGKKEVARLEDEMKKIVKDLGHNMSLKDFISRLRSDKKFYYDSPEDVLQGFKDIVEKRIAPKIPTIFTSQPKHKLEVVPSENDGPPAFYIAGTPDGARTGKFFVNIKGYKSQPKYDMMTLSLHEGNPGHHLQASFSISQGNVPTFRTYMEDRSYFLCPSRFPINTAYVEGWGLYSESLGFDMKLYEDPYDRFGTLSASIFRACRLVVDTGMHSLGWSRQQALDYMLEHAAWSKENTEQEVNRYITWPGQALGYKIGEIRLRQLREKAERELEGAFDIRRFHDVVLTAPGPLSVLEEEVDKFIQENKK